MMESENNEVHQEDLSDTRDGLRRNEASATGDSFHAEEETSLIGNVVADQTKNAGSIIAGIAVMAPHTHIDQRGATIIVQQGTSSIEENPNVDLKGNEAESFLETMKKHFLEVTESSITATYGNLNEMDPTIQPSMGVIDLKKGNDGKILQQSRENRDSSQSGMDIGVTEIKPSQLHDSYMGKTTNRVFLLGDVGSSKTTTAKLYARTVLNGDVEGMKDIELVHFISVSDLLSTRTTAFDLLVSQQVLLDEKTKLCGKKWLSKNASKTLFVLDGLDQSAEDLSDRLPKVVNPETIAPTNAILANLISGKLYPGMNVLITSRWNAFWKLEHKLRLCKTVVLRGFDDQKLKNAADTLAGQNDGGKVIDVLRNSSLLSLCRSPMFLVYAIEVYKQNTDNPPDNLTSLMSAVLKHFERSENWNDDFRTLSKLAYHGIIDTRYTFTENYVRKIGIDQSKLGGILTPSTQRRPNQARLATGDTTWSFPHQSLQEFLGALGIFDRSQDEFDLFVQNELNKAEMDNVRKFVYGMVLNPTTRRFCEAYLKDKSVSLKACKKTLMKQLDMFVSKGVIDDIQVISLLHECGAEVIPRYKSRINRISINAEFLKPEDEYSLMSVITKCIPLKEVQIQRLEMTPSFMRQIRGAIDKVEKFEIKVITAGKHITTEDCRELTDLAPRIHVHHTSLWTTDSVANRFFQMWIDDKKAPCRSFTLKGQFSEDTFRTVGRFLSKLGADCLNFNQCELTKQKFKVFCNNLEKGAKLSELGIMGDYAMTPEVYEDLTVCLKKGRVESLGLVECSLTAIKMDSLNRGIRRNKVKLKILKITDDANMPPDAYRGLAGAIGIACVQELVLGRNEVTVTKLHEFEDAAVKSHVKLARLYIVGEGDIKPCVYRRLASTAGKTHVQTLVLNSNEMTEEKFGEFSKGAEADNVKVKELKIIDDANMTPDAYCGLAGAIKKACVQELVLGRNEVTEAKLKALEDAAVRNHVKLEKLHIFGECGIKPCTYRRVASMVGKTSVQSLGLGSNEMTEEKFGEFSKGAEAGNVKVKELKITDDSNMTPDAYRGLAGAIKKACVQELALGRNEVTEAKLKALEDAAVKIHVKLAKLQITGEGGVKPYMYRRIANTVGKTHVQTLVLDSNDMTEEKFGEFSEGAEAGNVKFHTILIKGEEKMNVNVYRSIPSTIVKASVKDLCFQSNKVTVGKLRAFSDAAEEVHLKLWQLSIIEDDLDIETIRELPTVVTKTQLTRLFLKNCAMTEDKFDNLANAAKRDGVQIRELQVRDSQMNEASYYGLARAVGKAKISWLIALTCDLTVLKLEAFGESIKANNVQFNQLYVWNDSIDDTVASELATTVKAAGATAIVFANCHLTTGKLQSFRESAERHNVKLVCFGIFFEPAMDDDCFEEIIQICQKANAKLVLHQCDVSDDRVRMLKTHIREVSELTR